MEQGKETISANSEPLVPENGIQNGDKPRKGLDVEEGEVLNNVEKAASQSAAKNNVTRTFVIL